MHATRRIAALTLALGWTTAAAAEPMPSVFKKIIRPTGKDNPRNGEGDLIELKDGTLLLAYTRWYKGAGADDAPAQICSATSTDGGRTWSGDTVLTPNDAMNVMSASFTRLQNGEILYAFGRRYSNAKLLFYVRFSRDEAKTWSHEYLMTPLTRYQGINNDHIVQLKSGRLLAPVFLCRGHTWKKDYFFYNLVYYSDDQGLTWTTPEPTALAAPSAPASIARIPSTGDLLILWNNHTKIRNPLTCAVSKDEGRSWQHVKNLEDDREGHYCYASITFVKNRVLLTYYEKGSLKFASIDVNWFYE